MKKILALVFATAMLCTLLAFSASAASFDYCHIVANANDPYGTVALSAPIDMDAVKWAVVKYRTITQFDTTGVELIGQIYASPAAEPFIPVKYTHSQQWETVVVDLTAVSEKATSASIWNTAAGKEDFQIRFDPMESNRDAEANSTDDPAMVSDGDSIDVAYIAFFDSAEKANAYDGSEATYVSIIDANALSDLILGTNIGSADVMTEEIVEAPVVEEAPAVEEAPVVEEAPAAEAVVEVPAVEAPAAAPQTADMLSAAIAVVAVIGLAAVVSKKK